MRFVGEADFEDRSLGCIAEVPQGAIAWFMEGDADSVLERHRRRVPRRAGAARRRDAARRARVRLHRPPRRARRRRHRERGRADRRGLRRQPGRRLLHVRRDRAHARHQRLPQPDARRPGARRDDGPLAYSWAAQQLTEYLTRARRVRGRRGGAAAPASSAPPRPSRPRRASSCATAQVVASIGFPAGDAARRDWASRRAVPGLGGAARRAPCDRGWLALARDGEPFSVEETALLRGMARALAQTVRTLELVGSLRSRQALLERLAQIQRSIVRAHRPRLAARRDRRRRARADRRRGRHAAAARRARSDAASARGRRGPRERDATRDPRAPAARGRPTSEPSRSIVIEDDGITDPTLAAEGIRGVMSAPVSRNGVACGLLTVATRAQGRRYDADERDVAGRLRRAHQPRADRRAEPLRRGPPRAARSAHRTCPTARCSWTGCARPSSARRARTAPSACCSSTSTASRRSTTRSATRAATSC